MARPNAPNQSRPYLTTIRTLAAINAATAMLAVGACICYIRRHSNVLSNGFEGRNLIQRRGSQSSKLSLREIGRGWRVVTQPEQLTGEEFGKANLRQLPTVPPKLRQHNRDYQVVPELIHHQHTVGNSNSNLVPKPQHIIQKNMI
jgi:hypothetical protein